MNLADIKWPAGRRNPAGITRVLYAAAEDILTMPMGVDPEAATNLNQLIEVTTEITMKAGKYFYDLYCTLETGEIKSKLTGPRDGKGRENTLEISFPGNEPLFLGFDAFTDNLPMVFLVLEKNGKWRIHGDLNNPAYKDDSDGTSGKAISDGRATKLIFKSSAGTSQLIYKPTGGISSLLAPGGSAPGYSATLTLGTNTVDQGDAVIFTAETDYPANEITKVEFYVNGTKVGEDSSSPFMFVYNTTSPGVKPVYAKVLASTGTINSASKNLTVNASFNTTLTDGQESGGVTLTGPGVQLKFNTPLPTGDPFPAVMAIFISGTQVAAVDFLTPGVGQACTVIYNGVTYNTTFINGNRNL